MNHILHQHDKFLISIQPKAIACSAFCLRSFACNAFFSFKKIFTNNLVCGAFYISVLFSAVAGTVEHPRRYRLQRFCTATCTPSCACNESYWSARVLKILNETVQQKRFYWHNPSDLAWLWQNRANNLENQSFSLKGMYVWGVKWPGTQITPFEKARQNAWHDPVTTPVYMKPVNSCVQKHLLLRKFSDQNIVKTPWTFSIVLQRSRFQKIVTERQIKYVLIPRFARF